MLPFFTVIASPVFIEISRSFGIAPEDVNLVLVFFTLGTVIGRVSILFYKRRSNTYLVIILYSVLVLIVLALFFIMSFTILLILYFVSGIILGIVMLIAGQLLMKDPQKNASISLIKAAFFMPPGFIAAYLASPLIVKLFNNWRYIYLLIIIVITVILIFYVFTRNARQTSKAREERIIVKNIFRDKNRNILFILYVFIMVSYVIAESSISMWAPTYLRLEKSLSISLGGISLFMFWTAMAAGRFFVNRLIRRFENNKIMIILTVLSLLSLLALFFSTSTIMVIIVITVMGLSFSGLWPLTLIVGTFIYKKGKDRWLNIILLSSSCGTFFAPYIIRSAVQFNMQWSIFIPLLFMGIVLVLLIIIFFLRSGLIIWMAQVNKRIYAIFQKKAGCFLKNRT